MKRVLVSGASGLIGRALTAALGAPTAANGFAPEVHALVRRPARAGAREVFWDAAARIDVDACEGFDAVVHLAGENVGSGGGGPLGFTGRWDARKKHDILASRAAGTALLARTLAALRAPPKVLVCASGVGFYGDGGDAPLTEAAPRGAGFLAEVAAAWEAAAQPAADAGVRVVHLRFGVVLSREGGMIGARRARGRAHARAAAARAPPNTAPAQPSSASPSRSASAAPLGRARSGSRGSRSPTPCAPSSTRPRATSCAGPSTRARPRPRAAPTLPPPLAPRCTGPPSSRCRRSP